MHRLQHLHFQLARWGAGALHDQVDFDPSDAAGFWDLVNRQDWTVCEAVQRGISARVHTHGNYAPMEDWNLDIRRYVTERIDGHVPP